MPSLALCPFAAVLRTVFPCRRALSASIAALLLAINRLPAQQAQILGINSTTTAWSSWEQLYRGTVKLNIKNNSSGSIQVIGSVTDCGPFVDDGNDCNVMNVPTIAAGATGTMDLGLPLWAFTSGNVKVVIGPNFSTHTDSALVHISVTNADGNVWTAQIVPFPEVTYTPSITHATSVSVAAKSTNFQTVTIANNGNAQGTYAFAVSCTGAVTGCVIGYPGTSTRTLAAGAASSFTVSYNTGAVGSSGQLRIIMTAPPRSSGLVQADTSTLTVNAADIYPPSISITPLGDIDPNTGDPETLTLAQRVDTITVDACDIDGTLGTPTLSVNGVAVNAISVTAGTGGCSSTKRAKFLIAFPAGHSDVTATVSDGFHLAQANAGYKYNEAPDFVPVITFIRASSQVQPSTTVTDTFVVTNPGWKTVSYTLVGTWCFHSSGGACTATPLTPTSISIVAGGSVRIPVTYTTTSAWGAQTTVQLTVQYTGIYQTVAQTSAFTVSTPAPSTAPIVTVTPGNGTVFTTPSTNQVRIDYCDIDDVIVQHDATWQGQALPGNFIFASRPGCLWAGYSLYSLALVPWQQNLVITARDLAGHVTTSTTTFAYAPPLNGYRPTVTATPGWHRVAVGSVTAADTFTIQNHSNTSLAYSLSASCAGSNTLSSCVANKGSVSLAPFASDVAVVTYVRSGALDYPDTLKLIATYTSPLGGVIADTGRKVVIAPSVDAAPSVSGVGGTSQLNTSSIYSQFFTVTNSSSTTLTFAATATATNGYLVNDFIGRDDSPSWMLTIPAGQSVPFAVNVRTPSVSGATGSITLFVSYVTAAGATLTGSATSTMVTHTSASTTTPNLTVNNTAPTLSPSSTSVQRFTITNTGSSALVRYVVNCPSGGAVVSCGALSHDTATFGNRADTVTLNVTTTAGSNLTGAITLTATSGSVVSTGTMTITTGVANGPLTISTVPLNPGASIARDQCLTIAAGDDAAYECGDLRLVHALPTTTTMNKPRTPTLIYMSAHAQPVTLVQVDVTIDGTSLAGACVTQIHATVRFPAGDASDATLPWNAPCGQLATRRIAVPVDARAHSHLTGLYRYTVQVQAAPTSGLPLSAIDTTPMMAVVNRATSPFGAGWWVDGVEQLYTVADHSDQLLWIGGDGTTRLYSQQAADTFVVTPALDRPDSIVVLRTLSAIKEYRRKLRNGAYVSFDSFFRHASTVNALGHVTRFVWHAPGSMQLDSIVLPVPNGAARRAYGFGYTSGRLSAVTAPAGSAGARTTTLSLNGNDLSIADPGLPAVHFVSDGVGRIVLRRNRLGDATQYDYDTTASVLTGVTLDMSRSGVAGDVIRSTFCPAEAVTIASCAGTPVTPSAVRTLVDGPRNDVPDTTAFYVTRFGAPRLIVDALGHQTTIERSDSRWPMLATATIDARGHTVRATYDTARALLKSTTDVNPNGLSAAVNTGDAVTTYAWHSRWDRVTEVVAPMNLTTHIVYDAGTGNRLEQSVGSTHTNRSTFGYDPLTRLVTSVATTQSANPTRLDYDAQGNLWHVTTPKGFVSTTLRDAAGRDSVVTSLIDSLQSTFRTQSYVYDSTDRVQSSVDAALAGSIAQTVRIVNGYDDEGHLKSLSRSTTPDTAHVATLTTDYTYDPAGRKLTEHDRSAPDDQVARWHYDAAGNVFEADTKTLRMVTMQYDTLNRLTRRTIPRIGNPYGSVDDVQQFTYDAVGNLLSATSPFAQVARTYTLAGRVEGDSLAIAAANLAVSGMAHGYRLVNHYDLAGRRISQDQPSNLAWVAGSGSSGPSNSYGYDFETGVLATVTDQRNNVFRYHYSSAGLLDSLLMPGGIVETHYYDDDGREFRRLETGPMGTMHDDHSVRDAAGRVLSAAVGGTASAGGRGDFTYAGLGAVLTSAIDVQEFETIQLTSDGFGHAVRKLQAGTESDPGLKVYGYTYDQNSNRLLQISGQLGTTATDVLAHAYDAAGNLTQQSYTQTTPMQFGEGGTFIHVDARWGVVMGYDAAGRLLNTDRATVNDGTNWLNDTFHRRTAAAINTGYGSYEEYRYDPLGRRVWKRTHRENRCTDEARAQPKYQAECASAVTVTVWDGDQALYEIRSAAADSLTSFQLEHNIDNPIGSGTPFVQFSGVSYLHGVGIDRPLELIRVGEVVVFHTSWRGAIDATTTTLGQFSTCGLAPDGSCIKVKWPGQEMGLTYTRPYTAIESVPWYGDLSQGQLDASGKMYMRNRYYDPVTGRFTQEDPIGLAGGVNLYGFAGGDPVNFSDPLGLWPWPELAGSGGLVVSGVGALVGGLSLGGPAGWIAITGLALAGTLDHFAGPGGEPRFSERAAPDATATRGSIPASGPRARAGERRVVNDIGKVLGCHECGAAVPGTQSGNWIPDHQPPTALNPPGGDQTLQPHCTACSAAQGGRVSQEVRKLKGSQDPPPPPQP